MKKEDLELYGKVDIFCEESNHIEIKITGCFSIRAENTLDLMSKILKAYPQHPTVETLITDDNLFHIKLKA